MKHRLASRVAAATVAFGCVALALGVLVAANVAPLAPLSTTWTDDFTGSSLAPAWSWLKYDPSYWSLTALPGYLRIITTEMNNNVLVYPAPAGAFEIRTRVLFTPSENYQQAGLSVRLDDANLLTLVRAFCSHSQCVGNGIYFDRGESGGIAESHSLATVVQGEAYLKIVRGDHAYTGYYSEDGQHWSEVGTHEPVLFTPKYVGLRAGNNLQPPAHNIPADFDYFVLVDHSHKAYLPQTMRTHR